MKFPNFDLRSFYTVDHLLPSPSPVNFVTTRMCGFFFIGRLIIGIELARRKVEIDAEMLGSRVYSSVDGKNGQS